MNDTTSGSADSVIAIYNKNVLPNSEVLKTNYLFRFLQLKKNGNGIGLSLCKQVMRLHKGHITFKTAIGEGTIFILQFELAIDT